MRSTVNFMPFYCRPPCSLDFLGLPSTHLFSFHYMLYVTFLLCLCVCACACACAQWGARPYFCHEYTHVFAHFDLFLFFFRLCVPPRPHPRRSAHGCLRRGSGNRSRRGHCMYFFGAHIVGPEMLSSSIKGLHHECGVQTASLSKSTVPWMACKRPDGTKLWALSRTVVVSHGPNL